MTANWHGPCVSTSGFTLLLVQKVPWSRLLRPRRESSHHPSLLGRPYSLPRQGLVAQALGLVNTKHGWAVRVEKCEDIVNNLKAPPSHISSPKLCTFATQGWAGGFKAAQIDAKRQQR